MSPASNSTEATGRIDAVGNPRPVRVAFPVHVSFDGANYHVDEFTANLSVGGIFLPAAIHIPVRARGSLTFRLSQWEEPFTVDAEVVWSAPPDQVPEDHPAGVGLMFLDLSDDHRRRLGRLVDGIQDGSVTEAIRRSLTRPGVNLVMELRKRPTERSTEIDALIQDGTPAAVLRLLSNPRTGPDAGLHAPAGAAEQGPGTPAADTSARPKTAGGQPQPAPTGIGAGGSSTEIPFRLTGQEGTIG